MSPVQVRRVDQYASRLDDLQAAPAETSLAGYLAGQ
jgi:hypothetical protein